MPKSFGDFYGHKNYSTKRESIMMFLLGVFVGTWVGFILFGLAHAAKDERE